MLLLISILILLIIPACTWWFGFWNNMLTMISCLLAALIATSAYPVISQKIIEAAPESYIYAGDFVGLWAFFAVSLMVLRGITDSVSKFKLKFDPITEMAGRTVFSLGTAVIVLCFASFTLQLAPLEQEVFGESGQPTGPAASSFPDQAWLGYAQYASTGPLASDNPIPNTFYEAASQYRYDNKIAKEKRAEMEAKNNK